MMRMVFAQMNDNKLVYQGLIKFNGLDNGAEKSRRKEGP